jgi:glycosyltransferase involved in cell wall biosynthesis
LEGYYSADVDYFMKLGDEAIPGKRVHFPHRFIFTGRYYSFKGIHDLWSAFIEWQAEEPNDWELWCAGTGSETPIMHPKIKHLGFIQPEGFAPLIQQGGVFVLPSHIEPWGVVLHEFAAAGFPLIASDSVGAADAFIESGKNGYIFKAGNKDELKLLLKKIASLTSEELLNMGAYSKRKALAISPAKWAHTLMSTINKKADYDRN